MGIKSKAMAGASKLHEVHENKGQHRSMAAQHEKTRLVDPENVSGDGNPGTHEPTLKNHHNRGSGATHGLAATHHTTRIADAPDLETEITGQ